jgi:hypothetical protein
VGGLAVAVRAEPRLTRDADVAPSVEGDAEAEAIVDGLVALGHGLASALEQEISGRLATVRLVHPDRPAKLLARDDRRRPADADDLRALAEVAGPGDRELAQRSVALIAERGYSRGRDLAASLAELAP